MGATDSPSAWKRKPRSARSSRSVGGSASSLRTRAAMNATSKFSPRCLSFASPTYSHTARQHTASGGANSSTVAVGDVLLEVDGHDVRGWTPARVAALIDQEALARGVQLLVCRSVSTASPASVAAGSRQGSPGMSRNSPCVSTIDSDIASGHVCCAQHRWRAQARPSLHVARSRFMLHASEHAASGCHGVRHRLSNKKKKKTGATMGALHLQCWASASHSPTSPPMAQQTVPTSAKPKVHE